jgi:hypothetical protein
MNTKKKQLNNGFGYPDAVWDAAKTEVKTVLKARAKRRAMIPYTDLCNQVKAIRFEPYSYALASMLGQVSREEDAVGRGLLSVIVVHKVGDMQPGNGFFELASELGRNTADVVACWVEELKAVFAQWSLP